MTHWHKYVSCTIFVHVTYYYNIHNDNNMKETRTTFYLQKKNTPLRRLQLRTYIIHTHALRTRYTQTSWLLRATGVLGNSKGSKVDNKRAVKECIITHRQKCAKNQTNNYFTICDRFEKEHHRCRAVAFVVERPVGGCVHDNITSFPPGSVGGTITRR